MQIVRPRFRPILPRMHARVRADEMLLPIRRRPLLVMVMQRCPCSRQSHRRRARETARSSGPRNQAIPIIMTRLMAQMPKQSPVGFVQLHPHAFPYRVLSLLDIQVMMPLACPVITPRSRSNARPCSGSSLTRETTGSPNARSEEISLRLAISMRRQHSAFSGKDKSGRVRFKRQEMHRRSSSSISQLHAAGVSRFWQRRYVLRPAPDPRGSSHESGAGPGVSRKSFPSFARTPRPRRSPRHTEFGKNTGRPHLQR